MVPSTDKPPTLEYRSGSDELNRADSLLDKLRLLGWISLVVLAVGSLGLQAYGNRELTLGTIVGLCAYAVLTLICLIGIASGLYLIVRYRAGWGGFGFIALYAAVIACMIAVLRFSRSF
jgi:hypothetical protein